MSEIGPKCLLIKCMRARSAVDACIVSDKRLLVCFTGFDTTNVMREESRADDCVALALSVSLTVCQSADKKCTVCTVCHQCARLGTGYSMHGYKCVW